MSTANTCASNLLWGSVLLAAAVALLYPPPVSSMPQRLRIPRLEPHPVVAPAEWGTFSHRGHEQLPCYSCHPSIFPQRLVGFRHADMTQGKYCGTCHDGARASAIDAMSCETCHAKD